MLAPAMSLLGLGRRADDVVDLAAVSREVDDSLNRVPRGIEHTDRSETLLAVGVRRLAGQDRRGPLGWRVPACSYVELAVPETSPSRTQEAPPRGDRWLSPPRRRADSRTAISPPPRSHIEEG